MNLTQPVHSGERRTQLSTAEVGTRTSAMQQLLTVDEVAEILRCSRAQVYAMVAEGSLNKVPLPYRTTRFTRESVERLIRGEVA
jgi:excisionase family DNA binding protein